MPFETIVRARGTRHNGSVSAMGMKALSGMLRKSDVLIRGVLESIMDARIVLTQRNTLYKYLPV